MNYEKFEAEMNAILGSGIPHEMEDFHQKELSQLYGTVHHCNWLEYTNTYYAQQDPEELRDGELEYVQELIGATEVKTQIIFSRGQ